MTRRTFLQALAALYAWAASQTTSSAATAVRLKPLLSQAVLLGQHGPLLVDGFAAAPDAKNAQRAWDRVPGLKPDNGKMTWSFACQKLIGPDQRVRHFLREQKSPLQAGVTLYLVSETVPDDNFWLQAWTTYWSREPRTLVEAIDREEWEKILAPPPEQLGPEFDTAALDYPVILTSGQETVVKGLRTVLNVRGVALGARLSPALQAKFSERVA